MDTRTREELILAIMGDIRRAKMRVIREGLVATGAEPAQAEAAARAFVEVCNREAS